MTPDTPARTVMVIDDNDVDRMMARRIVNRSNGVDRFLSFPSGVEALDFLETDTGAIDLILLDRMMPRMDGLAFLEHATTQFPDRLQSTAIYMLTTLIGETDMEAAATYPALKGFLDKPLSDRKMADLLHNAT